MKRLIIYASVYGGIGVVVGVLMALYTQDVTLEHVLQSKQHTAPVIHQPQTEETHNG